MFLVAFDLWGGWKLCFLIPVGCLVRRIMVHEIFFDLVIVEK